MACYLAATAEEQALEGSAVEAQRRRLEAHCSAKGLQVEGVYADVGRLGEQLDRSQLAAALTALEDGRGTMLLVVGLDRLSTSVTGLGGLLLRARAGGFPLLALAEGLDTSCPAGRHAADVLVSVSRWQEPASVVASRRSRRPPRGCWQTGRMLPASCPRR